MRQKQSARVIRQHEREAQALELRKAGATYAEIASQLGMSVNGVWKAIQRALERIAKERAEEVRTLELARLDALQGSFWLKARRGDGPAADRVLRIMDRRAKYLGLDAANKHEVSGPAGTPIPVGAMTSLDQKLDQLRIRLLGGNAHGDQADQEAPSETQP